MGIDALDWTELVAWADRFYSETTIEFVKNPDRPRDKPTPILLKYSTIPDEDLQIIRQMSQDYCSMSHEATDPNCPCPKEIEEVVLSEDEEEDLAANVLEGLRALGFLDADGTSI